MSLDSTPDEGHVDQLTLIFRYIENDSPVERFLKLLPNQGHKAEDMFQGLKNFLRRMDWISTIAVANHMIMHQL